MDSICPLEASTLAHAVIAAVAGADPLDLNVLRTLAADAAKAGRIERILVLVAQDDGLHAFGPVSSEGPEGSRLHGALLLDIGHPVGVAALPDAPTCIEGGAEALS